MIYIDGIIANYIVDNCPIFAHIHPNYITLFGFIMNFVILYLIKNPTRFQYTPIIMGIVIFLRWLADALDGAVARKYNKTSYIGGCFDTISDIVLFFIVIYYCFTTYNIDNKYYSLIIALLVVYFMYYNNLSDHSKVKKENNNALDIVPYTINNLIIIYFIFYLIYLYNYKLSNKSK